MLSLAIGNGALQSEDDLFGGLGLLSEDGLGLTSVSLLLAVVTTFALSCRESLPFLYCVTLWTVCFLHLAAAQKVRRVLGTFTIFKCFFKFYTGD